MDWEQVQLLLDPAEWERLPGNGWGAVIAAAAGTASVAKQPIELAEHRTQVTVATGRRVRRWTEPRSVRDQADIDEAANEYLAAAGLPARPAGFDWYVRIPPDLTTAESFVEAISARINETDAVAPADVLTEARRAITTINDRTRPTV